MDYLVVHVNALRLGDLQTIPAVAEPRQHHDPCGRRAHERGRPAVILEVKL
jgi:hypothetical protein